MPIAFNNVQKNFQDQVALQNINCTIPDSGITAILGYSGSGKTTMAKMINGLVQPDSGTVAVNGLTVNSRNLRNIRNTVGFVSQAHNLFWNMNVIENITYAALKVLKKDAADVWQQAEVLLENFGLENHRHANVKSLSGGQQQRVAIARALITGVKFLVMDEPTSALDPQMIQNFLYIVTKLRDDGIGILIVTHNIAVAQNIADNIIFLSQGAICDQTSSKEFFDPKNNAKSQAAKGFLHAVM